MRVWTVQRTTVEEVEDRIEAATEVLGVCYTSASARLVAEKDKGEPIEWLMELEDGKQVWLYPKDEEDIQASFKSYKVQSFVLGIS